MLEYAVCLCYEIMLNHSQEADKIQEMFSYEKEVTMYHLVPAFEQFLAFWDRLKKDPEFEPVYAGIKAGVDLMQSYYEKTDLSVVAALASGTCVSVCYSVLHLTDR